MGDLSVVDVSSASTLASPSTITSPSTIGVSQVSSFDAGGASDSQSSLSLLLCIGFVLLLTGVLAYAISGPAVADVTETRDDGFGSGGGGGGGGGSSGPIGPAPGPLVPRYRTLPAATTLPTPSGPFSVSELVCTVGDRAVLPYVIPADGLCTYLYYSDVLVAFDTLAAARTDDSWDTFRAQIKNRSTTKGGISFDIQNVDAQLFTQTVIDQINNLAGNNIKHYGLLTVVAQSTNLAQLVTKAKTVIEKLKDIQGNDTDRKTIIALGLYDYSPNAAWSTYQAQFREAVENTKADTVIALSSTGWQETERMCYAAPPSAVRSAGLSQAAQDISKKYPNMVQHASLVARNATYRKPNVKLGLSFELGTLMYKMNDRNLAVGDVLYAKCFRLVTDHRDVACYQGFNPSLVNDVHVGKVPGNVSYAFIYEDTDTLQAKVDALLGTVDLRPQMSWLVSNVHLGDYTTTCGVDPFQRLNFIARTLFQIP